MHLSGAAAGAGPITSSAPGLLAANGSQLILSSVLYGVCGSFFTYCGRDSANHFNLKVNIFHSREMSPIIALAICS